jgi:hypothetical protein
MVFIFFAITFCTLRRNAYVLYLNTADPSEINKKLTAIASVNRSAGVEEVTYELTYWI